jgi:hypothetical protein
VRLPGVEPEEERQVGRKHREPARVDGGDQATAEREEERHVSEHVPPTVADAPQGVNKPP